MDRYQRVEKPREERAPIKENEIRITAQGRVRSYITYAISLLEEQGFNEIIFKAMGRAINKTVTIVELMKRRIVGLHQNTLIGSIDITDTWEPLEEGLLPLETTRHVSIITITLSKKELDASSFGYQSPLPEDQVKPIVEFDHGEGSPRGRGRGRGLRGRGRGGRDAGNGFVAEDYENGGWDAGDSFYGADGWGRGRGHDFHGRGRGGGYGGRNSYRQDTSDVGGYDNEAPAFRGRGRGRRSRRGRGRARGHDARPDGQQVDDAPNDGA